MVRGIRAKVKGDRIITPTCLWKVINIHRKRHREQNLPNTSKALYINETWKHPDRIQTCTVEKIKQAKSKKKTVAVLENSVKKTVGTAWHCFSFSFSAHLPRFEHASRVGARWQKLFSHAVSCQRSRAWRRGRGEEGEEEEGGGGNLRFQASRKEEWETFTEEASREDYNGLRQTRNGSYELIKTVCSAGVRPCTWLRF